MQMFTGASFCITSNSNDGSCRNHITFENVLGKAKKACQNAGIDISNHFTGVSKMVAIGSGLERSVEDIMLTRYACYLVAQNDDPRKPEIAFEQNYFAVQTRVAEVIEQRLLDYDRLVIHIS